MAISRRDFANFNFRDLNFKLNKNYIKLLIEMFFKEELTSKNQSIFKNKVSFYIAVNYLKRNKFVEDEWHNNIKVYKLTMNGEIFTRMLLALQEMPKPFNDWGIRFV